MAKKKKIHIIVPGTPVVIVEDESNARRVKGQLRRNAEANLDDTIAESFPASDPPSTVPNAVVEADDKKAA